MAILVALHSWLPQDKGPVFPAIKWKCFFVSKTFSCGDETQALQGGQGGGWWWWVTEDAFAVIEVRSLEQSPVINQSVWSRLITSYADLRRQWSGQDTPIVLLVVGDLLVSGNWLAANSWASYFGCRVLLHPDKIYITRRRAATAPSPTKLRGIRSKSVWTDCVYFCIKPQLLSFSLRVSGGPAPPTTEWLTDCLWMHSLALQIASTWTCLHRSI